MKEEKRQNLLILMCWLVYVSSYLSRYSYNSNIVAIKDYYGVTNSVTGLVSTCFFFAYGTGQLVNGLMCKKYNAKVIVFSIVRFDKFYYIYASAHIAL